MANLKEQTRFSQRDFVGFGLELSDSLNRYASWRLSQKENELELAKKLVTEDYTAWIRECPHISHVCFADITFFSPDRVSVRDALTLVFTPGHQNPSDFDHLPKDKRPITSYSEYTRILHEVYLQGGKEKGHTMAPHSVFQKGLPQLDSRFPGAKDDPETADELDPFFDAICEHGEAEQLASGFFWERLKMPDFEDTGDSEENADSQATAISGIVPPQYWAKDMEDGTYGKEDFTDDFAKRVSTEPISKQFKRWCEVWDAERKTLRSALGKPIHHIVSMPVGYRDYTRPSEYTLVGCVFLCVDCIASNQQVEEILRYIYLHIQESNATAWIHRKADLEGRDAAIVPASHEISRVISVIQSGLPDSAYTLLRDYFFLLVPRSTKGDASGIIRFPVTNNLTQMIKAALDLASQINALSLLAESNSDGICKNLSEEEIKRRIGQAAEDAMEATTFSDSLQTHDLTCKEEERNKFYLAVLGAIRNALFHSVLKSPFSLEFSITPDSNLSSSTKIGSCLLIRNSRTDFRVRPQSIGDPTGGTLKALRAYARSYGKDPRRVRLERFNVVEVAENKRQFIETWQTTIPLPGNR